MYTVGKMQTHYYGEARRDNLADPKATLQCRAVCAVCAKLEARWLNENTCKFDCPQSALALLTSIHLANLSHSNRKPSPSKPARGHIIVTMALASGPGVLSHFCSKSSFGAQPPQILAQSQAWAWSVQACSPKNSKNNQIIQHIKT